MQETSNWGSFNKDQYNIIVNCGLFTTFAYVIYILARHKFAQFCFAIPIVLQAISALPCPVYVQYMSSICSVYVQSETGQVMDKQRRNDAQIMGNNRRCIGGALEMHWRCIGSALEMHWRCIGGALEMHWRCIGDALEMLKDDIDTTVSR